MTQKLSYDHDSKRNILSVYCVIGFSSFDLVETQPFLTIFPTLKMKT